MEDKITKVSGIVTSFKAVTKNRVQIELCDFNGLIELFIDQSWVIRKGDKIVVSGLFDETGKYVAHAYKNISINIKGWREPPQLSGYSGGVLGGALFGIVGIGLCMTGVGAIIGVPFALIGGYVFFSSTAGLNKENNKNHIYEEAKILIETH